MNLAPVIQYSNLPFVPSGQRTGYFMPIDRRGYKSARELRREATAREYYTIMSFYLAAYFPQILSKLLLDNNIPPLVVCKKRGEKYFVKDKKPLDKPKQPARQLKEWKPAKNKPKK